MPQSTFRELLHYTTENIPRPKPLAAGHYVGVIKTHEFGFSRQKQTPQLSLLISPEEECNDIGDAANDGVTLGEQELRKTYYITPRAVYRIGDMLDAVLGEDRSRSLEERIPDLRGVKVMFDVSQRVAPDGSETYNDVGTIVKA